MKLTTAILTVAAAGLCATAIAQTTPAAPTPTNDTVKLVIANGVVIDMQGMPIDMKYAADGTFTGAGGMFSGTYKASGDKICIQSEVLQGQELCNTYPAGKKAGDTFPISSPMGEANVTISAAPAAAAGQ